MKDLESLPTTHKTLQSKMLSKSFTVVIQPLSTRLIKPNFCIDKETWIMISLVWILVLVYVECSIYTNCLSVASFVFQFACVFGRNLLDEYCLPETYLLLFQSGHRGVLPQPFV